MKPKSGKTLEETTSTIVAIIVNSTNAKMRLWSTFLKSGRKQK